MHKKFWTFLSVPALTLLLAVSASALDGGRVNDRLNVRTAGTTSSTIKTTLASGSTITLISKSGNWWYTEYAPNSYGYVHGDYVTAMGLSTATVRTQSTAINVRASASASASIVGKLQKGEQVDILGTYGNFYKILYDGNKTGYASTAYLTIEGSTSTARSAITLSVPSYKQYNYTSLRLPGSNEPVSTHGCAVTSLAMTESYRTGTTVTPATVIQKQSFTSTGALYWPSPYSRGENTLAYMYSQLAAGKPVIVHVKKSNGSTHFAVVYGFSGGELTASNFKLLDPGSASRTTLQALYNVYPTLVKTLSY